jgi:hypothetical protein
MSLNVGNISARFGLDPSEFLEKMRGVSGSTKFFSDEMKRSMKESSREGAESFRLIDEALGIRVSRPLTRILTQEFPAFGSALQSILGVSVFGALASIGVEAFEKVSKSIEKAMHAQEEWQAAIRKTEVTIESVADSYVRKIAEANGLEPLMKRAMAGADEAKAAFDKVSAAIDEQNKKAEEASGLWTHFKVLVGETWNDLFTSASGLNTEKLKGQLDTLKIEIQEAFRLDALHGTHDAMQVFQRDLDMATQKVKELTAAQAKQGTSQSLSMVVSRWFNGEVTPAQIAAAQEWVDLLDRAKTIEKDREKLEGAQSGAEALKDRIAFYRQLNEVQARLSPQTDPLRKLEAEVTAAKEKAVADFEEMRKAGANALTLDHALAQLDRWEHRLDEVVAKAKASADVTAAEAKLPTKIAPTGQAPVFAEPTPMPAGRPLSAAGAKLDSFSNDSAAQLRLAAQAYQDALTPQDKYKVGQAELQLLGAKGLIDQNSYTAAMMQLDQQMVKAATSAHKLQEEMQKLLERSNDAGAGLKAYAIQLQLNAEENGKFIYDVLTSASKGAEDDAAKTLMDILDENRGGHRALIKDLEKMWSSYFRNLAEMGMKNMMDRALAPLGKAIGGAGTNPSAADSTKSGSAAPSGMLGWLMPKAVSTAGAGGTASLSAAGTMLTHAGTELLSAAMALRASASTGGGGGGNPFFGGGAAGDDAGAPVPFFGAGGDATPGSSFISGESGAEEVNLDGRGGAHITPLGMKAGGDTHIYNDFSNNVMTDDLMRRAEGLAAIHASIHASEGRMLSSIPTMQREIALRKRS